MLKVFSRTKCPKCIELKSTLNTKGIQFEELNLDENSSYRDELRNNGFRSLPVIKVEDKYYDYEYFILNLDNYNYKK